MSYLRQRECPACNKPVGRSHRCRAAAMIPPPPGWRARLRAVPGLDLDVDVQHVAGQLALFDLDAYLEQPDQLDPERTA